VPTREARERGLVISHRVTSAQAGRRLDALLSELEPELSRAQAQRLIERGHVMLDGRAAKPARRVREGEVVEGEPPPPEPSGLEPESIPLRVLHEDRDLIVIDKPAGIVVHPSAGHARGTLVNALLHHCGDSLSGIGGVSRPGIVHRLDKDTSGVMVVAKNDVAHQGLAAQFKAHSIERAYLALVRGTPRAHSGTIDAPIARHPTHRKRFTTRASGGRRAVTHWRVERRFARHSLLRVFLETGRTHQIRVHLASIGLPVAGDPVYGVGRRAAALPGLRRQALHAAVLGFQHPCSGQRVRFEAELASDLAGLIQVLLA
jgi:23S rRNA pseudouridine1911/1915/1917 synthase